MANTDAPLGLRPTSPNPKVRQYLADGSGTTIFRGDIVKIGTGDGKVVKFTTTTPDTFTIGVAAMYLAIDDYIFVYDDPDEIFEVQGDGAGDVDTIAQIGQFATVVQGSGNATTQISAVELDTSSISATQDFVAHVIQIVDVIKTPTNDPTLAHPKMQVRLVEHAYSRQLSSVYNLHISNGIVLPKATNKGIKVELATPTFPWRDLLGDLVAKNTGSSKPNFTTYRDSLLDYQFSATEEEYFKFHIPHDYVAGTHLHLHVHWSNNGQYVNGGNVTFEYEISYSKSHNQMAFGASVGTTFQGDASTQYKQVLTEVQISATTPSANQIDSDDIEPDGVILARLILNSNDMTVSQSTVPDPFIHYCDIHYQSTNIGTKEKDPDFYR